MFFGEERPPHEGSIAASLARLTEINDRLTSQLIELTDVKAENVSLRVKAEKQQIRAETTEKALRAAYAETSALQQEIQLGAAQRRARWQQYYANTLPKIFLFTCMSVGVLCINFAIAGLLPPWTGVLFPCLAGYALIFFVLVMRPVEAVAIRMFCSFLATATPLFGLITATITALSWHFKQVQREPYRWMILSVGVQQVVVTFIFGSVMAPALKMRDAKRKMPMCPPAGLGKWSRQYFGEIFGRLLMMPHWQVVWAAKEEIENSFAEPPRLSHQRLICVLRAVWFLAIPILMAGAVVPLLLFAPASPFHRTPEDGVELTDDESRWLWASIGLCIFGYASILLTAPAVRSKVAAKLAQLATRGEAGRAAGVAAMIGGANVQKTLLEARRELRGVRFSRLEPAHFASNEADESLHGLSERCHLGEIDAFVSHSWHDDAHNKWEALERWCSAFENSHGRDPVLWFDKCCLRQDSDLQAQVARLPVFLAGSRKMLCLVGRTYPERIWCIVELFTHFSMGGLDANLEVVPVVDAPATSTHSGSSVDLDDALVTEGSFVTTLLTLFRKFEVSESKCFSEEQRQLLLSIIQTGFGSFERFNSMVRHTFANKLERLLMIEDEEGHMSPRVSIAKRGSKASNGRGSFLRSGSLEA